MVETVVSWYLQGPRGIAQFPWVSEFGGAIAGFRHHPQYPHSGGKGGGCRPRGTRFGNPEKLRKGL